MMSSFVIILSFKRNVQCNWSINLAIHQLVCSTSSYKMKVHFTDMMHKQYLMNIKRISSEWKRWCNTTEKIRLNKVYSAGWKEIYYYMWCSNYIERYVTVHTTSYNSFQVIMTSHSYIWCRNLPRAIFYFTKNFTKCTHNHFLKIWVIIFLSVYESFTSNLNTSLMQFLLLLNNSGWWYKFMNNFSMLVNNLTMLISHLITINVGCGLNFIYINKFINNHFRITASWGIKIIP